MKILVEKKGYEEGMIYNLGKKETIGRESTSSIQLLDQKVSRNHAEIHQKTDSTYILKDLGSANGTYINGMPVAPNTEKLLDMGDQILLGDTILEFREATSFDDEAMSINISSQRTQTTTTMDFLKKEGKECAHILNPGWIFCPLCGKKLK